MTNHQTYMHRCLDLARLGAGNVAPNPMVGAVLVYNDRVIGEGYHQKYGEAHAEVNCINQVIQNGNADLLDKSTLYVSLEPCVHFGKTPPCTGLILANKIPNVVIGCRDPFEEVNGKGIEKLKEAGVKVEAGILEKECIDLNKRFFTFHTKHRPYVILKWAQTADGKIATLNPQQGSTSNSSKETNDTKYDETKAPPLEGFGEVPRLLISNEYSNRLVHKWRSEEASVLVGTNTAMLDDPELTTRLWPGHSPLRLILDMNLRLPLSLKIFDKKVATIIFNGKKQEEQKNLKYYKLIGNKKIIPQIVNALFKLDIQSVLVEGGTRLLQSFIDEGVWDEARIITNEKLKIENGLGSPEFINAKKMAEENILSDKVEFYKNIAPD